MLSAICVNISISWVQPSGDTSPTAASLSSSSIRFKSSSDKLAAYFLASSSSLVIAVLNFRWAGSCRISEYSMSKLLSGGM